MSPPPRARGSPTPRARQSQMCTVWLSSQPTVVSAAPSGENPTAATARDDSERRTRATSRHVRVSHTHTNGTSASSVSASSTAFFCPVAASVRGGYVTPSSVVSAAHIAMHVISRVCPPKCRCAPVAASRTIPIAAA